MEAFIQVRNLSKVYKVGMKQHLFAVDDISFDIFKGETLGLVGESGCGKSTTGKLLVNLIEPTMGQVLLEGQPVEAKKKDALLAFRKKVQIIFQDPYASLNPRMKVMDIIAEGLVIHGGMTAKSREERVFQLMDQVGLKRAYANRHPHEFSGGQRQRIGIARALALKPEFIVCDEPISALDVSIQAQVINLLNALQKEYNLTYLFISHDIKAVKLISDRIAVMYLGRIVEIATGESLFKEQYHPYTKGLIAAIPIPDPEIERKKTQVLLEGDMPSPIGRQKGCSFYSRCQFRMERCLNEVPVLKSVERNHRVACHLYV